MKNKPAEGILSRVMPESLESGLMTFFGDGIRQMYYAERQIAGAIPTLVINTSATALADALELHMTETHGHIARLEKLMALYGLPLEEKTCATIDAMILEGVKSITAAEKGLVCDTAIIAAAQKVEHFEIANYGTLRTLAEQLGFREAAGMLDQTLDEEKLADTKLTETASTILYTEISKTNVLNQE
jgi:ferritin-like metal-binding protein YciE